MDFHCKQSKINKLTTEIKQCDVCVGLMRSKNAGSNRIVIHFDLLH